MNGKDLPSTIADIDFGQLYRNHLIAANAAIKPPSYWDGRAEKMTQRTGPSEYAREFIARMDFTGASSLLDVGCGTGAIALNVADRLESVVALDYSQAMLDALLSKAAELGYGNIRPLHLAWESDWAEVPVCDIVVASRSTMVADMADALTKLNAKARRRVYLTSLAGGHFVDPDIAAVAGVRRPPLPDYIYAVNILHGMGIHPCLSYIETPSRLAGMASFAEFSEALMRSLGPLDETQLARLRQWFEADPQRARQGGAPQCWAFLSWEPPAAVEG